MATNIAEVLKFRFGATVIASDGEAGEVAFVVVQPGTRTVTHVGVKLPGGATPAVPLDRIVDGDSQTLRVNVTREALLQAMPTLDGQLTSLSRATQAQVDGKNLGTLSQVTMQTADHKLRRLGVKRGMLGSEVLIPANAVTGFGEGGRTVEAKMPAGEQPQPYRPDDDVLSDMHDALWNYNRLRVDLRAVVMRVIDGEAWIRGHVSSTLNRRVISDLVLNIPGLHETHNELVADNDLAVTIARALAKDPRMRGQMIGVYPNLGRVFLRGRALSPEAAQTATQIAAEASGQAEIINQLGIDPTATILPVLAAVTGTDDIVPGGD